MIMPPALFDVLRIANPNDNVNTFSNLILIKRLTANKNATRWETSGIFGSSRLGGRRSICYF